MTEIYLMKDKWNKECMPQYWNLGIKCPIFKIGDMKKVTNYRGISLLDIA